MSDVISRIRQGQLWDFPGGIHPPEMKKQSNQKPIRTLHLPKFFYVPVLQHSGEAGELIVQEGDLVLKGQPLTKGSHYRQLPVHSPTSGKIVAIAPHVSSHPSGLAELTIVIETDGKDQWIERQPIEDFLSLTSDQIIQKVYQAGIAGLGGAVFPTSSKLHYADKRCRLLIINGAECEPYITCDDRLMQDYAAELIEGIRILRYVLRPEEVVLAIEDNKPKAIKAIEKALRGANDIILRVIPTKYPSGASDQLVQILTGLEIPQGKRSIEMGIVMHNVGTAFAIKRAVINDEPLIERVVTLTGDKIRNKGNVWARLGTPILHLLEQVDYQADERFPVFLGGPMMGFILPSLQSPITKTANCIIAPDHFEYAPPEPERSCIRCSACSDACPVGLLPQQLYWFARAEDHDKAKAYHLDACIECGVCAYVCPSYIPLIQYFRQEKAKIADIDLKAKQAEEAKQRFEAREARLNKEKEARTARIQQAAEKRREEIANQQGEDPVAAALARLKAKKEAEQAVTSEQISENRSSPVHEGSTATGGEGGNNAELDPRKKAVAEALARARAKTKPNGEPDNSELMAQRRARKLAKQAENEAQQGGSSQQISANTSAPACGGSTANGGEGGNKAGSSSELDPRKKAIAEALARAKAKKVAQQGDSSANSLPQKEGERQLDTASSSGEQREGNEPELDPRKKAVAEALTRAKAKKAAQQGGSSQEISANTSSPASGGSPTAGGEGGKEAELDPRKKAIAEALARAKAKKAAQQGGSSEQISATAEPVEELDPRKKAIAEALARAKAKKTSQQGDSSQNSLPQKEGERQLDTASSSGEQREGNEPELDPRKKAVAEALARAKAKKAAQQAVSSQEISANTSAPASGGSPTAGGEGGKEAELDPRKKAVAEALARAKAKKAAQQAVSSQEISANTSSTASGGSPTAGGEGGKEAELDPRKKAVAEALARAKAKKAAQQAVISQQTSAKAE